MFSNPFSPIFGGKPDVFFGRTDVLSGFDRAMDNAGSDDRAIFITGTRGSGKTALLEQLSIKAGARNRVTIDLGPENTIMQLVYTLADYDEITKTVAPQINVSVFGVGGGASGGSVSKTSRISKEKLPMFLLDACSNNKNGLLVTVDEVQKVPIEDVSELCNAFQMASRKGCDIMLAVAGLPYSYSNIIQHEGCTYLRRAAHKELGLFTWEETTDAFNQVFSNIKGLNVSSAIIDTLNTASYGHPYIMQLLGYHLITYVNEHTIGTKHNVTDDETQMAIASALITYEQRALKPLVDELPHSVKEYLVAASKCMGEDRMTNVSDIASKLNTTTNKLSKKRAYLLDHGILAAPERGKIMFCVPYLADYVKKEERVSDVITVAQQRRV